MDIVIFSKNRAFQLEALLRSITLYCDIFSEITILYKADNFDYKLGYKKLEKIYSQVKFIKESDFKSDLETIIGGAHVKVGLFCDDIIFFRKFFGNIEPIFQFRLGENIKNRIHFKYTYSVQSTIFYKNNLLNCLSEINYFNVTSLEANLQRFSGDIPNYSGQYIVELPLNRVSDTSHCPYAGMSEKKLNELFLDNKILDFQKMKFDNFTDVHYFPNELKFKQI